MPEESDSLIGNRKHSKKNSFFSGETPLRALVFSHDLNLEGASLSLFEIISELRRRKRVEPEVLAFEDGRLREKYEAAGIPISVYLYDPDKLSTVKRLDREVAVLAGEMRRKKPQLVLANTLRSFLAILAAKEAGISSIWILRESAPWETFFFYLTEPVAQQALSAVRFTDRVIFVSHASREVWKSFDLYGNFEVIHNGIDRARFSQRNHSSRGPGFRTTLGVKDDSVVVLCLGTLNARKGQNDLISALEHLPNEVMKKILVLFVGDDRDPYAKKLKKRCQALTRAFRESIRFYPTTEFVQKFYEAADIFVFCSREESYPRVTLEAMAFGLPIITTPVHGVTEQVVDGENAFFYEAGKSDHLAEKIETLVRDESLRRQMGKHSLQRLSKLTTFKQMTDAYAAVCSRVAQKMQ